MTGSALQVVTAGLAVAGTLSAALLTQLLGRRAERDRRAAEDASRWLAERLRVSSSFLAGAIAVERKIWSVCSFLDRADREQRLPGFTSIFMTPESGIPNILSAGDREILVDALHGAYESLDKLEDFVAEISIIGSPNEALAARSLQDALWNAGGIVEAYASFDDAADAVERCRAARDRFAAAARVGLRVSGEFIASDNRPRLADHDASDTGVA